MGKKARRGPSSWEILEAGRGEDSLKMKQRGQLYTRASSHKWLFIYGSGLNQNVALTIKCKPVFRAS